MAVAFDVATESHTGTTGDASHASFTWNHTGGGSARGALVFVFSIGALTDTSVTYGGTTMAAVPYTGADTDTEPGSVRAYYLDNVATGTQAVVVNRTNNAVVMYAVCFTVTAATATEVYPPGIMTAGGSTSNTGASSSGTGTGTVALKSVDDGSPGSNSLRFMGRYQGTSNVTAAGSGSTAGPSIDFGLFVIDTFRETTAGQGARNVGGATITDDVAMIALAVREVARLSVNAGLASITTTASGPTDHLADFPTAASLTITAQAPTASEGVIPTAASLATTAQPPTASEGAVPTAASLAVTAQDSTVATLTVTSVQAEAASISATAGNTAPAEGASPGAASATLAAQPATFGEGLTAGSASATLSAANAAVAEAPGAQAASLTVAGQSASPGVGHGAEAAQLALTATDATVQTIGFTSVEPEAASISVSANDATVVEFGVVAVHAEAATFGVEAQLATVHLAVPAAIAELVVAALNASIDATSAGEHVDVTAGVASITLTARNAAVTAQLSQNRFPAVRSFNVSVHARAAEIGIGAHDAVIEWNDDETALRLLLT